MQSKKGYLQHRNISYESDSWQPSDFPFDAMTGPRDLRFDNKLYSIPEHVE